MRRPKFSDEESRQKRRAATKRDWARRNPEKMRAAQKRYQAKNRSKRLRYRREYDRLRRADPHERMLKVFRDRIRHACRSKGIRTGRSRRLLGCTLAEFKQHLELMFQPGMTWANYGKRWQVDHIIPCAAFNLRERRQQRTCFHYSNLQPLWRRHNLAKRDLFALPHE